MPLRIRMELPAHAVEKLLAGWRNADPELASMLGEFRILAIQSEDERALADWENDGGR
jgi:hypothetical protein